MMDPDVDLLWDYFRHLFPWFTVSHVHIYKLLWRVEPRSVEQLVEDTKMSKATVYGLLHELAMVGLVRKTSFRPIGYFAANPLQDYAKTTKKLFTKLESGKEKLAHLLANSNGLSGEVYFVKKDGDGQQRLMLKNNRQTIRDEQQLLEIKKAAETQLMEIGNNKARAWAVYR